MKILIIFLTHSLAATIGFILCALLSANKKTETLGYDIARNDSEDYSCVISGYRKDGKVIVKDVEYFK